MRVLIVLEDFRKDQYILKPTVAAMMAAVGQLHARIIVCCDPLLGSIGEALKTERIHEIIDRYRGMVDLFLPCVEHDGDTHCRQRQDELEHIAQE